MSPPVVCKDVRLEEALVSGRAATARIRGIATVHRHVVDVLDALHMGGIVVSEYAAGILDGRAETSRRIRVRGV